MEAQADVRPAAIPHDTTFKLRHALLAPDGKIYPVPGPGDHSFTFRRLVAAGQAEGVDYFAAGFLHMTYGSWTDFGFANGVPRQRPTQAQLNTIFDWSVANPDEEFPSWVRRFMEMSAQ